VLYSPIISMINRDLLAPESRGDLSTAPRLTRFSRSDFLTMTDEEKREDCGASMPKQRSVVERTELCPRGFA